MSFTAEAVLSITFVPRAVLCAVRIKLQKEIIFLRVLLYCMTKSYPLEQIPHPQRCQNPDITLNLTLFASIFQISMSATWGIPVRIVALVLTSSMH